MMHKQNPVSKNTHIYIYNMYIYTHNNNWMKCTPPFQNLGKQLQLKKTSTKNWWKNSSSSPGPPKRQTAKRLCEGQGTSRQSHAWKLNMLKGGKKNLPEPNIAVDGNQKSGVHRLMLIGIFSHSFTRFYTRPSFFHPHFCTWNTRGLVQMSFFLGLGLLAGAMLKLGSVNQYEIQKNHVYTSKIFASRHGLDSFLFCEDCFLTKQNNKKQVQARCRPYQPFSIRLLIYLRQVTSHHVASQATDSCLLRTSFKTDRWKILPNFFPIQKWETWTVLFLVMKLKSWHLSLLCITLYSSNKACTLLFLAYQVFRFLQNHVNKGHQKVTKSGFCFFSQYVKTTQKFHLSATPQWWFSRTSDWLQVMRKPPWGFKNPLLRRKRRAITTQGKKTREHNIDKYCRITTNKPIHQESIGWHNKMMINITRCNSKLNVMFLPQSRPLLWLPDSSPRLPHPSATQQSCECKLGSSPHKKSQVSGRELGGSNI